ncbi:MAG TPA: cytochrome C oxidase subunit IV family protein [Gemmatimonadales bacterium]
MSEPPAASGHGHPGTGTYLAVAAVLTIITVVEVGVFYVPAFKAVLVPTLLVLSTTKFALVVMFYMHLKSDHKLFTLVFSLPLMLALGVGIALLLLYGAFVRG